MSSVTLNNIVKRFGNFTAVHQSSLEIEEGAFVTLLGPSGCGKTTNLRMIAGLLDPTEGEILIGGKRVNDVPIHKRTLALSSRITRCSRIKPWPKTWLLA